MFCFYKGYAIVQIPEFLLIFYNWIKWRYVSQDAQNVSRSNLVVHHCTKNDTTAQEHNAGTARKMPESMIGCHTILNTSAVYTEPPRGIDATACTNVNNKCGDLAHSTDLNQKFTQLEKQLDDPNVECKKMLQQTVKLFGIRMNKLEETNAQIQRLNRHTNFQN